MTDSYHFESVAKLEPGEFVINTDESVSACLMYSGGQWTWDKQSWASGYKSMEAFTQNLIDRGYKRSETIVFPSGAAVLTSGDKIVGRVEAGPATYDVSVGNCLLTAEELHSAIRAVIDSFRAQDTIPEPIRPALDWNTATPFEPFADFIVTKGAEPTRPLHTSPTTDSAYPAIAGLLRG